MMKQIIKAMLVMALALVLTLSLTCAASCEETQNQNEGQTEAPVVTDPEADPATPADPEPVGPIKATSLTVDGSFENQLETDARKYIQVAPLGSYQIKATLEPANSNSKINYEVIQGYEWAIEVSETGLVKAKVEYCNKAVIKVTCEEFTRWILIHVEEDKPYVSSRSGETGEQLRTVSLPSNWYWDDPSEYIEDGTNYFWATYKPADRFNKWYGISQEVRVYGDDEEYVDTTDYIYYSAPSSKNTKMNSTLSFDIKTRSSRSIKKYELTVKDKDGNILFEDSEKFSSSKSKYTYKLEIDERFNDASSITVQFKATDNKNETWKSEKYKYNITGKTVTVTKGEIIGSKMSRKQGYFSNTFLDVKASNWFYPYVVTTYEYDLLLGSNRYFKPNDNMTIAEAIALASRLNVIYNEKTQTFDQTKGSNWYDTYVDYALKNSIINASMFSNYNKAITREDFVKVLYNTLPVKEYEAINYIKMNDIPDYKVINKYSNEVYTFYNAGILTGTDRWGTFKPESKITRAEVSAIVSRLAKLADREYFSIK